MAGEDPDRGPLGEERPLVGLRRTVADRLGESYREAIHVTEHRELDAEALLAAVEASEAALGQDLTMVDLLLVALSAALDEHPAFNATLEDGVHRLYEHHNVGVAVDLGDGLVTPVLRDVADSTLRDLAADRRALVQRTREGEYTLSDLRGGTVTISNLGPLGVDAFTPIINPPQVAILGVNRVRDRAVPESDGVAFRRQLPVDLSFDHRAVDGADAARFLGTLADHVEDPWPLLPDEVEKG